MPRLNVARISTDRCLVSLSVMPSKVLRLAMFPLVFAALCNGACSPEMPPIPGALAASHSLKDVRAAYEFAATTPDVFRSVPCYCGCERLGHTSIHDCFVRSEKGRDIVWNEHAAT